MWDAIVRVAPVGRSAWVQDREPLMIIVVIGIGEYLKGKSGEGGKENGKPHRVFGVYLV